MACAGGSGFVFICRIFESQVAPSTTSIASLVMTANSVAVNAPTTRSGLKASPSTPQAEGVEAVNGGESLTAEKLENVISWRDSQRRRMSELGTRASRVWIRLL
ncbi:hypothetical protein ARMSODRAFT_966263 [Armillaria solidipes]|uniref:Uncharacterized protein n=1 Tax=Armillaria solidipes TaxID=1076256 RepID=A0A2H3B8S4_9AGAR|nr:hypothetical protein ARMSODRAFT_966263 [Armillaria solidipes]